MTTMSSMPSDLNFLEELLAQPERAPRTSKSKDVRNYDTWFKLAHNVSSGCCSNEKCVGVGIPNQFKGGQPRTREGVTSVVNDYEMCRFCFLDGWHYIAP